MWNCHVNRRQILPRRCSSSRERPTRFTTHSILFVSRFVAAILLRSLDFSLFKLFHLKQSKGRNILVDFWVLFLEAVHTVVIQEFFSSLLSLGVCWKSRGNSALFCCVCFAVKSVTDEIFFRTLRMTSVSGWWHFSWNTSSSVSRSRRSRRWWWCIWCWS